jgi:hypothetical protein
MVLEKELLPYYQWLVGSGLESALFRFGATVLAISVLALVIGFLVTMVRYGPLKAGDITYQLVTNGIKELWRISARRVFALAGLAVKEALRRRVLVALVIFGIILLFAGWFLRTDNREPAKLYLSFVLTATTYLTLLIALLLSAFSLPADFKNRTIYTIVTKPVRAGDIVLGRILGFTLVGTAMLAIMGICSYLFVVRSLHHTHTVELTSVENIVDESGEVIGQKGTTSLEDYHRHEFEVNSDGIGEAFSEHGHWHEVKKQDDKYVVSGPRDYMRARVPLRGTISFLDRQGTEVARGVNVGNEWTYRSFIEGASSAAAIWTFEGIDESVLQEDEDGTKFLPVELIVRVFRTHKGNIERGILGSIQLRNPDFPKEIKSTAQTFLAKDISIDEHKFDVEQYNVVNNEPINLLTDLVTEDGRLEVMVHCLDGGQYYGFAQADCYIPLPDASPLWNFVKTYISIWVQMVLVITIGVTASTFLSGAIAMMFTVSFILLGFFREFFLNVATGDQVGGGPVESLVRMVTQRNQITRFEPTPAVQLMEAIDQVLKGGMVAIAQVLPDFRSLSTVDYVANGFQIPANAIFQQLTLCLAYVIGLSIIGYFFLRTREVAQ